MRIRPPRARALLWAMVAALVGACDAAEPPRSTPPESQPSSRPPEPRQDLPEEQRSVDLFGAWLVESVSAPRSPDQRPSREMILLIGNRELEILSQCVTIGPYIYGRIVGGGIGVRVPGPAMSDGAGATPPPPQCARALSPAEQAISPLLLAAEAVERKPDGSVMLKGEGGALLLRRPAGVLPNPRGEAPPPAVPPTLGAWRFVRINGRPVPPGEAMELMLRPGRLEWRSGCVNEVRSLARKGDALLSGPVDPFPICERGRSGMERAATRLFEAAVTASMTRDGSLRLEGSGIAAQLEPLAAP